MVDRNNINYLSILKIWETFFLIPPTVFCKPPLKYRRGRDTMNDSFIKCWSRRQRLWQLWRRCQRLPVVVVWAISKWLNSYMGWLTMIWLVFGMVWVFVYDFNIDDDDHDDDDDSERWLWLLRWLLRLRRLAAKTRKPSTKNQTKQLQSWVQSVWT